MPELRARRVTRSSGEPFTDLPYASDQIPGVALCLSVEASRPMESSVCSIFSTAGQHEGQKRARGLRSLIAAGVARAPVYQMPITPLSVPLNLSQARHPNQR